MSAPARRGSLYLVPNALDASGAADPSTLASLDEQLPRGVLRVAARLGHWVVEDAKAARAFLKRVAAVVALDRPLQEIAIVELPKASKGGPAEAKDVDPAKRRGAPPRSAGASADRGSLLDPARDGHDIGLLSDAGLPGLADPGAALVAAAHEAGIAVVALPGASAVSLAIAASGLDGQRFSFVGYVPVAAEARAAALRALEAESRRDGRTQVLIEAPYRNAAVFEALLATLAPTTRLAVGVGLTMPAALAATRSIAAWRSVETPLRNDVPATFAFLAAPGDDRLSPSRSACRRTGRRRASSA